MSETVPLMSWHVRLHGVAGRVRSSGRWSQVTRAEIALTGDPSGITAIRIAGGYGCGTQRPAPAGRAHTG